jgi:predicted RNase H-like HicB family nuclease
MGTVTQVANLRHNRIEIRIVSNCKSERKMKFKVVLEESEDGGYTVYVPSLPGCISEGGTIEESMRNIEEAIQLYLEPVDDDFVFSENALIQEIEL